MPFRRELWHKNKTVSVPANPRGFLKATQGVVLIFLARVGSVCAFAIGRRRIWSIRIESSFGSVFPPIPAPGVMWCGFCPEKTLGSIPAGPAGFVRHSLLSMTFVLLLMFVTGLSGAQEPAQTARDSLEGVVSGPSGPEA